MSSTENVAWLLTVAAEHQIAIAECELMEYVLSLQLHKVPAVATHCSDILLWRVKPVPVMQLSMLIGDDATEESATGICVVAYHKDDSSPLSYVGLPVFDSPAKITIDEDQACTPSEELNRLWSLPNLSLAFFSHAHTIVPIVNIKELCANRNRAPLTQLYEPTNEVGVPNSA